MADSSDIAHLMVERGPDKGRRITVPDAGARIGRSSQNDIELTDPSISRFQCRVFFKPDGLLWIADLGSTNETLVNAKPVLESRLNLGDTIEIGESIIRVIADNLKGIVAPPPATVAPAASPDAGHPAGSQPAFAPPAAFSPLTAEEPAVQPVDLGLVKERKLETGDPAAASSGAKKWLWLLLVMMLAAATLAVLKSNILKPGAGGAAKNTTAENAFAIYYEKVNGSSTNIFRYSLTLENEKLAVQIDSLTENRHVSREKKVAKDVLDKLKSDLDRVGFFKLDANYQGLQPDAYQLADMEITIGTRNHRSAVLNRLDPEEFRNTREMIEEFAKNELGLITISLPPAKLVEMARDACLQGQKLHAEREVKYGNLWDALRAFDEAQLYLETIEPKPEFYATIVKGLTDCQDELKNRLDEYKFAADKNINLRDWKTAAENLRIILELVPDNSREEYATKYRAPAEKSLVDVERRIASERKGKR